MSEKTIKKRISIEIPQTVLRDLNVAIAKKYGNVHGHIGESISEGIQLWIEKNKEKEE